MSVFLPPNHILDNPEFLPISLKPDGEGGHRLAKVTHYTRVPSHLGDGWEDVLYFRHIGSHNKDESRKNGLGGYVYILTNKQYPGNCKIGFTTSSPQYRLQKINGAGVVDVWELAFDFVDTFFPGDEGLLNDLKSVLLRKKFIILEFEILFNSLKRPT
jgi:hypothetical protein